MREESKTSIVAAIVGVIAICTCLTLAEQPAEKKPQGNDSNHPAGQDHPYRLPIDMRPLHWIELQNVEIHDADTIKADVILPLGVTVRKQTIRAAGFDAWEVTRARRTVEIDDAELRRGIIARDELKSLASGAKWFCVIVNDNAVYGRIEALLFLEKPVSGRSDTKEVYFIEVAEWARVRGHVRNSTTGNSRSK